MKVQIGTSGYSYEDWRAVFYPTDLPKGKMLNFYAEHFKCVEINSTYYGIPNFSVFHHMCQKTPEDFEFIVKFNQETTHKRSRDPEPITKLIEACKPLVEGKKFSGLLAQFPYSFKNIEENRSYIIWLKEKCGDYPVFLEFRNWTWNRPELADFLSRNQLHYVNVDEPPLRGLLKPQEIVTGDTAYVRFHGRNSTDWWQGTNQTRYNYLYSEAELESWMITISRILKKAYKTYIFFNNHPQGKAIQNAKMMIELISHHLKHL
jgi:uncharacterized protein YecE (DUF72 family)